MSEEKVLFCNKCGKKIKCDGDLVKEGVFSVSYEWGYFSGKDGERHHVCLCESCYDKLREAFAIPVRVEDYMI